MKTLGYYNGSYGEIDAMYVPMCDRAYYFGDGIYDVVYVYNHVCFALDEHVERFLQSLKDLKINFQMGKDEITQLIERMVKKVDGEKLSVYMQVSRGSGYREHAFPKSKTGNLCLMIKNTELRDMKKPIKTITANDKRHGYCKYKTLNLLANVISFQEGIEKDCQEVILLKNDKVTECAHSNVSILKNGTLITPPNDGNIFPGIARNHLLKACEKEKVPYRYEYFTKDDLIDADEIIITASGSLCLSVQTIDEKKVGGKDKDTLSILRNCVIKEFYEKTGAADLYND